MADVIVAWTLPVTRKSGKPLKPEHIAHVEIEISADGGSNFGGSQSFPPSELSYRQTELEAGQWFFRGRVVDTRGRQGSWVAAAIEIEDETPPGDLSLSLTLA